MVVYTGGDRASIIPTTQEEWTGHVIVFFHYQNKVIYICEVTDIQLVLDCNDRHIV